VIANFETFVHKMLSAGPGLLVNDRAVYRTKPIPTSNGVRLV
jgi:hypothetical protein